MLSGTGFPFAELSGDIGFDCVVKGKRELRSLPFLTLRFSLGKRITARCDLAKQALVESRKDRKRKVKR